MTRFELAPASTSQVRISKVQSGMKHCQVIVEVCGSFAIGQKCLTFLLTIVCSSLSTCQVAVKHVAFTRNTRPIATRMFPADGRLFLFQLYRAGECWCTTRQTGASSSTSLSCDVPIPVATALTTSCYHTGSTTFLVTRLPYWPMDMNAFH